MEIVVILLASALTYTLLDNAHYKRQLRSTRRSLENLQSILNMRKAAEEYRASISKDRSRPADGRGL